MAYVIAVDVGGTNTRIAVCDPRCKPIQIANHDTKKIKDLSNPIKDAVKLSGKKISRCCIAFAGPISGNKARLTNGALSVDTKKVEKGTKLKKVILINDFQAVGYGIPLMKGKQIVQIKKGKKIPKAPIAVIGAGTGLGKTYLTYDESKKMYFPNPSEGGHVDFAAIDDIDWKIMKSTKKRFIDTETMLSGAGITLIYKHMTGKKLDPAVITANYHKDKSSKKSVDLFIRSYARAARNSALEMSTFGGVYLAGGIAAKIVDIIKKSDFAKIFVEGIHKNFVKDIPIYIVVDYDVSLYGAASVAQI